MAREVLFISACPEDARVLQRTLGDASIGLEYASDVEEAKNRLTCGHYAAIVSEESLPDGTWLDILSLAKQQAPAPPVVVTRAHADTNTWLDALQSGAFDMINQPFETPEVLRILGHAIALGSSPAAACGR